MKIYSLVGFQGCGKSTAGQRFVDNGFTAFAWADPLKDAVSSIFSWDRELLSGDTKESRIWREEVDQWWASKLDIPHFSPRFALQNIGTDIMRNCFDAEIWIHNMEKRIVECENDKIIITDTRHVNEAAMIKKLNGKIYRIKRGPDPLWMPVAKQAALGDELSIKKMSEIYKIHNSEWNWMGEEITNVIENDENIDQLYAEIDNVINQ